MMANNFDETMYTLKTIIEEKLKEKTVTYAFFTTYTISMVALEELFMSIPDYMEFFSEKNTEKSFDIFVDKKQEIKDIELSYLSTSFGRRVHTVYNENGVFHPKICLFKYLDEGENKILLIVSSCNITNAKNLDAYVYLIGEQNDNNDSNNGKELYKVISSFLSDVPKEINEEKLKNYNFYIEDDIYNIDFIIPNRDLLKELNNEKTETVVVSPFVSKDLYENMNKNNVILYNKAYNDDCNLHAKIYLTHINDETDLYVGSANYTYNAFSVNGEILVKLGIEDSDKVFYDEINNKFDNFCDEYDPNDKSDKNNDSNKSSVPPEIYKYLSEITISFENGRLIYKHKDKDKDEDEEIKFGEPIKKDFKIKSITPEEPSVLVNIEFEYGENFDKTGYYVINILQMCDENKDKYEDFVKGKEIECLRKRGKLKLLTGLPYKKRDGGNQNKTDEKSENERTTYISDNEPEIYNILKILSLSKGPGKMKKKFEESLPHWSKDMIPEVEFFKNVIDKIEEDNNENE